MAILVREKKMYKYDDEFEKDFNYKAYKIKNNGSIKRDWVDLLKSKTAQKQVKEARKASKSFKPVACR